MKRIIIGLGVFMIFTTNCLALGEQVYHRTTKLMGCRFDITVVAEDEAEGEFFIQLAIQEIARIESMISSWNPNSQTSLVNKNAGIQPVRVDQELFDLVERANKIARWTGGAFDLSFASMDRIWRFDGSMNSMPNEKQIAQSVRHVDYRNIILDHKETTIFLKEKGMKIGFGAIGKGYAADQAKKLLLERGATAGIINASGDLSAWGVQPDGSAWTVAITNPLNKEKVFSWLPIRDQAVVTSGNYEQFVEFDGKRYSHIIDPRTGYPSTGILSVTVFTQTAELADALATAVFVLGEEKGLDFINALKNVDCIIVNDDGQISKSKNVRLPEGS